MQSAQIGQKETPNNQVQIFKVYICNKVCKLCNNVIDNSFCISLFLSNKNTFKKFLYYVSILNALLDKRITELKTFDAFTSVICHKVCNYRGPTCLPTQSQLACYDAFLRQSGEKLSLETRASIYKNSCSKTRVDINYSLNELATLEAKLTYKTRVAIRKRIKRAVRKANRKMLHCNNANNTTTSVKVKNKDVITTCLYNNTVEWERKLARIFTDEAAN